MNESLVGLADITRSPTALLLLDQHSHWESCIILRPQSAKAIVGREMECRSNCIFTVRKKHYRSTVLVEWRTESCGFARQALKRHSTLAKLACRPLQIDDWLSIISRVVSMNVGNSNSRKDTLP